MARCGSLNRSSGRVGLLLLVSFGFAACADRPAQVAGRDASAGREVSASLSVAEAMGGADTTGYARALEPRAFVFPRDHGPHPDFRTEWWYVTGNLESAAGRRFGFQFTLFRNALTPDPLESSNPWASRQMYMGHFTVTDVQTARFHAFERFTRAGGGLAGSRADEVAPFEVWLDDWRIDGPPDPAQSWPMRLRAADSGLSLDLALTPLKPIVLQGDRGLSQKGPEPGNASFYYSFTRLEATGRVVLDGDSIDVTGLSWLDREWSTSALSEGQVGWDWFSLQLDDGSELMLYDLRRADGTPSAESEGVRVSADGEVTRLAGTDYTLTPTDTWTSPIDGAVYPSGWRIDIPRLELELEVEPVLRDQELDVTVRYWEGAVDVRAWQGAGRELRSGGARGPGSEPIRGRGYVELTGYAGG